MNINKLIEELELDSLAGVEFETPTPVEGCLSMRAAGTIRRLADALLPFVLAAEKADKASEDQKRLLGSEITPDASPGWGIKRKHLDAARKAFGENT